MGLNWKIFGKAFGDFRLPEPEDSHAAFLEGMRRVKADLPGLGSVFIPDARFFTANFVSPSGLNRVLIPRFVHVSRNRADGSITGIRNFGLAILNADCPIVGVFDIRMNRLAILHAGFRCLIRENPDVPSIIKVLFWKYGFRAGNVEVFAGLGIGARCYGAEHYPEVKHQTVQLPLLRAIRGPRKGKISVDLGILIRSQLLEEGVTEENIVLNRICTACSPDFHSHVREGPTAGRNLSVV